MKIRPLTSGDWPRVQEIYAQGIATRNATFETETGDWPEWDRSHVSCCRLVAEDESRVLGWAALTPVSDRCVYGGVAEVSVYVGEAARGRGVGKALMDALVRASEDAGYWTLQAGVFVENEASIHIHREAGFRLLGTRKALGKMEGRWRDVAFLERRSRVVGVD